MKSHYLLALSGLLLLTSATRAGLIITEVDPAGSSSGYAADWFEVTNTGGSGVDITGWKMDDSSNAIATAVPIITTGTRGSAIIAPGMSVLFLDDTVSSGPGNAANDAVIQAAFISAWFGGTAPAGLVINFYGGSGVGLSTGGDGVNLFDSLGVHQAGVSFGSTTTFAGATLDNAAGLDGGTISTKSVAGLNGAFSNGAEIGSPGTIANATPEPASLGVLGVAGALLLMRRRRAVG